MIEGYSPQTDLENLKDALEQNGVAVLPNVFTEEECDKFMGKVFSRLKKNFDVETYDDIQKLYPFYGGIINTFGIPLFKEVLDLKTHPKTVKPFELIWDEKEIVTSLDSIFIGPPPELTKKKEFFNPKSFSLHTDQASNKKEFCCVQAFINLENTDIGDGCLSVLTNSHLYHKEFFEHFNIDTQGFDWFALQEDHIDWFLEKGCEWKAICVPKGSMVFWDSRTFHQGTLPREDRPNKDHLRFLVYVCYAPKSFRTKNDFQLIKTAYTENRPTSHWPYKIVVGHKTASKSNKLKKLKERHKVYLGIE